MSWFMGVEEARQHMDRARRQLETVQRALSSEPQNPEIAVTWAFYAYEKCIVALAERYGYRWTKNHGQKLTLPVNSMPTGAFQGTSAMSWRS